MGLDDDYDPNEQMTTQSSQNQQHGYPTPQFPQHQQYGYTTPQQTMPFFQGQSSAGFYRPCDATPPPRQIFEGMGTRLFDSNIQEYMSNERMEGLLREPPTQTQQEQPRKRGGSWRSGSSRTFQPESNSSRLRNW